MLRSMMARAFVLGFMFASTEARSGDPDPYGAFSALRLQPKAAPDVALPAVGGKTVGLSDYKGKVVLLGFFKTF